MPKDKEIIEKNEAQTKKVAEFLESNNLDIKSQLLIVLENGQLVPIQGITAQSLVVEKENGQQQPTNVDTGKKQD